MKKVLAIAVLGLLWSGNVYAETIHLKCVVIKESKPLYLKPGQPKWYEYFTIDPENKYAETIAGGEERKMEKWNHVHPMTKIDGKYFIWGNSYYEGEINFYHFYQIDLKKLRKKGKSRMAYVTNLVVYEDGMIREEQYGYNCNTINKAPQFYN